MGKSKRDKCVGEAELKAAEGDGVMEEVTPNPERPEILSPEKAELKAAEGSFAKSAQHPSGLSSARQPKVFIKTFGWPMAAL
jgi:hypothetical protein